MKKTPDFTLVRKFNFDNQEPLKDRVMSDYQLKQPMSNLVDTVVDTSKAYYAKAEEAVLNTLKSNPGFVDTYINQPPEFQKALVDSFVTNPARFDKHLRSMKPEVNQSLIAVIDDLSRNVRVYKVGLLDMGAWIGGLPQLLKRLNKAQSLFTLFEVQAPIPGGLLKTSTGMAEWVDEGSERKAHGERKMFEPHVIFEEFYAAAESIRKDLKLDQIVGLTAAMVAFTDGNGNKHLNYFTAEHNHTILLSTYELRKFAEDANRPYEVAVGALLTASLFVDINSDLHYHEDRGCLFDFNEVRESIVTTLRNLSIDKQCLRSMTHEESEAALRMLRVLKRMKRSES